MMEVSGGMFGMPTYDTYVNKLLELRNPADLAFLNTTFPDTQPDFLFHEDLLTRPSAFSPFIYEAAIALGLAACAALEDDNSLHGKAHVAALKHLEFTSLTGRVAFDNVTASRDPSSAMYRVDNWIPKPNPDNASQVVWDTVLTHVYENSEWQLQQEYIFNDGTTDIPVDIAPPIIMDDDDDLSMVIVGGGIGLFAVILGLIFMVIREKKRKSNDSVWKVRREDLHFADPPEVLGSGTFGLVLLGEYRGTQVAVKRVIPPKESGGSTNTKTTTRMASLFDFKKPVTSSTNSDVEAGVRSGDGVSSGMHSADASGILGSWAGMKSFAMGEKSSKGLKSQSVTKPGLQSYRKLKEEFIEEMRYLSRLRHPCVTTVMGAVMDKGEDPMVSTGIFFRSPRYKKT